MATRTIRFAFLDRRDNVPRPIHTVIKVFHRSRDAGSIAQVLVLAAAESLPSGDTRDIIPQDSQCRIIDGIAP